MRFPLAPEIRRSDASASRVCVLNATVLGRPSAAREGRQGSSGGMEAAVALAPAPRAATLQTDSELVASVRRGDDRAFEELYGRYQRRISSYIFGMVKDHARAEDLTQDVFMSALRRMRDTDRPIAFKPWIYE